MEVVTVGVEADPRPLTDGVDAGGLTGVEELAGGERGLLEVEVGVVTCLEDDVEEMLAEDELELDVVVAELEVVVAELEVELDLELEVVDVELDVEDDVEETGGGIV